MKSFFEKKLKTLFLLLLLFALSGCAAPEDGQTAVQAPASTEKSANPSGIVLSELMPSNKTVLTDSENTFCDWIELHNTAEAESDISGYWFSDEADDLMKWQIPSLTMAPDEYKVIYFSKKNVDNGELHCSFKLPKEGGSLYFSDPRGKLIWSVSYGGTTEDQAIRLEEDRQTYTFEATPGFPNTDEGYRAFRASSDHHGALVINEAALYNDDYNYHANGYYDWVELKNASDEIIDLGDYYISDSADEPYRFRLPACDLEPGELFVLYCGEAQGWNTLPHAPFSLDSKGDELYVVSSDGTLSDRMGMRDIPLYCSKGRVDGESGFFFFADRTPGDANGSGCIGIGEKVTASVAEGIYEKVSGLSVELSAKGKIYYTLDGSKPTQSSTPYAGAILVDKTTVIRAISCEDGLIPSECSTFSYILNEGHTLPVMSIACAPRSFSSMYSHNLWQKIEANCTLFDGDDGFSSECKLTLHGTSARTAWIKKNFKLIFSDRYGGDITYSGFENTDCTQFHSLVLRGGDDAGMQIYRDSLASLVAYDTAVIDPLTLDSKYCVLYVNGNYWGIVAMREAYSEKYGADHTGTQESGTEVCRAPVKEPQSEELIELINYIAGANMTSDENYEYVSERVDLKSFAQWLCYEAFFNNMDPTGNIRYIRGSTPESKWMFALFDFDIAMLNKKASLSSLMNRRSQLTAMTESMRRSETFCRLVLETAAELRANGLTSENVLDRFNSLALQLEPEMDRELDRWDISRREYDAGLTSQRSNFTEVRDRTWLEELRVFTHADDEMMKEYFPDLYS